MDTTEVKLRGKPGTPFPYYDLAEALKIVRIIHTKCGGSCSVDQIAGELDQTAGSGAFRLRLSAVVQFGLIRRGEGRIVLTDLGEQALSDEESPIVRLEAFFSIGLYKRVYEAYQGKILPSAKGLESKLKELGVVEGQVERARQVLLKSAEVAGLFGYGKDRLVKPTLSVGRVAREVSVGSEELSDSGAPQVARNDRATTLHPAIAGMLDELPAKGTGWSIEGLDEWVDALKSVLRVVYKVRSNGRTPVPPAPDPEALL